MCWYLYFGTKQFGPRGLFIFWNQTIWPKRQNQYGIISTLTPNRQIPIQSSEFENRLSLSLSLSHSLSVSQLLSCGAATRPHLAPRLLPCSVDGLVLRRGAAPTQPSTENGLPNLLLRRVIIRHRSIATLTNWYGASLSLSPKSVLFSFAFA